MALMMRFVRQKISRQGRFYWKGDWSFWMTS